MTNDQAEGMLLTLGAVVDELRATRKALNEIGNQIPVARDHITKALRESRKPD